MPPEAVLDANEISLNAVRYPITKPVLSSLSSLYPEKLVTGDYSKESQRDLSVLGLTDHRGGIGLDTMEGQGDTHRSWYSTCDIRFKGHLILGPLATNTPSLPAGLSDITHLLSYQNTVYANVGATTDGIYAYAPDTGWGANLLDPGTSVSNSRWGAGRVASDHYLAFGTTDQYVYYNGSTWTARTIGSRDGIVTIWNKRIWGVSLQDPYNLWYTFNAGAGETASGATPMGAPTVKVGQLFAAKLQNGEETLYLAIPTGLWAYQEDNDEWHSTGLQLPDNAQVGTANFASAVVWRDKIYFATLSHIYEYALGPSGATIRIIGPALDDGLPSTKGYIICDMVASLNDLIVSIMGNSGLTDNKTSIIAAWNGQGWRILYEAAGNDERLAPLLVAGVPAVLGPYRLWFANRTTSPYNILYIPLPSSPVNPNQITTYTYAAAGTHDWPWFTAGQSEVTKVAVRVKVETRNPTTAETVKVYYAINRSTTFQIMTNSTYTNGTITAAGLHTFEFPSVDSWVSTTAKVGTAFRSIQFRVVFARGSTNTNTPDVLSLTLEYYKKLDAKWAHQVEIDLSKDYKGKTTKELRSALLTAVESSTLVEYTHRDPDTNTNATFYVQARSVSGLEQTGNDERGAAQVQLVEV